MRVAADVNDLEDLDDDDPRHPQEQIANRLRAAILSRKFQPGDQLPAQNALAARFGVARDTAKKAIKRLEAERLIITRQGAKSYVRAQVERPVELRPHIEGLFSRENVSIDFFGHSGETLVTPLVDALDRVRAGKYAPDALNIRAIVTDTSAPLAVPTLAETGEDQDEVRMRSDDIVRRSVRHLLHDVREIGDLGLIKSVKIEVRVSRLAPEFKLFILNEEDVFFGFYPVVSRTVTVDSGPIDIFDIMGKDSIMFPFSVNDDESSSGPRFVAQARTWFDSVWTTVARTFK